jgi:hypothetical protein
MVVCLGRVFIGRRGEREASRGGGLAACNRSMPGAVALGACWRARSRPVVLSQACRHAREDRGEAERWGGDRAKVSDLSMRS